MALPFVQENNDSRERLEKLVQSLTEADLARTTSYGWTVAALLAHLAFWDQRMLALLRRWHARGVDESPVDSEAVNEALKPLFLALDPHKAAELCLESARDIDAELEKVSTALIETVQAKGIHFRFNRALHRDDHLKDIQALVGRSQS